MIFTDYIKQEVNTIIDNANFTDDELDVFKLLTKGKTIIEISMEVGLSTATVSRRIQHIKKKVKSIMSQ